MNKKLRRSVVALTTALACLVVMATPASATVVTFRANFDSGTGSTGNIHLQNGTATWDIPLNTPGGTGCGSHVDVSMDIDSTGSTGTVQVLGLESVGRVQFGTVHYISVLSWVSTPQNGTITGSSATGATITSLIARLRADLYVPTNTSSTATDCARTATLVCRYNNVNLHLAGTWVANIHDVQTSHGGLLTSSSASLTGLPCSPPLSIFTGGTATINVPLQVHVCEMPAPTTSSGSCPTT